MTGSLAGGLLYRQLGPAAVIAVSTVLITAATVRVAATRGLLPGPDVDQQEVTIHPAQR